MNYEYKRVDYGCHVFFVNWENLQSQLSVVTVMAQNCQITWLQAAHITREIRAAVYGAESPRYSFFEVVTTREKTGSRICHGVRYESAMNDDSCVELRTLAYRYEQELGSEWLVDVQLCDESRFLELSSERHFDSMVMSGSNDYWIPRRKSNAKQSL